MKKSDLKSHLFYGLALTASLVCSSAIPSYAESIDIDTEEKNIIEYTTYAQGLFEVSNYYAPDYVWDLKSCTVSEKEQHQLQLYHPLDVNQQKFYFENFADNSWRISEVCSGQALTANASEVSFSAMEHPQDAAASQSQTWILEDAGDQTFYIQDAAGNYLTLYGPHYYNGQQLSLDPFTGKNNQKWRLIPTWISSINSADTDLVNPYGEDGPYHNLCLVLDFYGHKEVLTGSMLAEQISENENHEFVLNPEYLSSLVAGWAEKYNTFGKEHRFRTTAGAELLMDIGNLGWELDQTATMTLLQDSITQDKTTAIAPVWKHEVKELGNPTDYNDIGDSYVEVDIGTQKIWLYHYGELLLESDCVTGTKNSTDTVQGVYAIFLKQSPATLTGPGYSSYVDFWMPFYNGYGLHNAGWRSSFGGEIYKTSGSHGCVNLPYDTAKLIYDTIQVGYPVVVYSSIPEDAKYHS